MSREFCEHWCPIGIDCPECEAERAGFKSKDSMREYALEEEITRLHTKIERLRIVFAMYNRSEGCGCCSDQPAHDAAENELAKILGCPRYSDNSGWDWRAFLRADTALAAGGE